MSDSISFSAEIQNPAAVKQMFLDVDSSVRGQLRRAMADVGARLRDTARGLAPQLTGALSRSIKDRLSENDSGLTLTVAPGKFYARFVEFGTAPHATGALAAAAGKGKGYARSFRRAQAKAARAAGDFRTKPQPFMQPAWDSLRDQIQSSLQAAVELGIGEHH